MQGHTQLLYLAFLIHSNNRTAHLLERSSGGPSQSGAQAYFLGCCHWHHHLCRRCCLCRLCHPRDWPGGAGPQCVDVQCHADNVPAMVGLLSEFLQRALSSLPTNSSGGGGGTIARSALTHLVGAGRVNLVKYSTCLHRLTRVVALPAHPCDWDDNNCNCSGMEQTRRGPGGCRTHDLHCWCARSRDGLRGGPGHTNLGGEQLPGKLDN